jgi:hypothetical protein
MWSSFASSPPGGPGNRGRYELALSLKQAGALKDGVRPDELKNVSVRSETLYDAERYARWSAILEVGYSVFRPREEIYLSNYAGRKRAKLRGPIVPVELDRKRESARRRWANSVAW